MMINPDERQVIKDLMPLIDQLNTQLGLAQLALSLLKAAATAAMMEEETAIKKPRPQ